MTLFNPRLVLALCAAGLVVTVAPRARRPPSELPAIDASPTASTGARVETTLAAKERAGREGVPAPGPPPAPVDARIAEADPPLSAPFGDAGSAQPGAAALSSACCVPPALAAGPPPPPADARANAVDAPPPLGYANPQNPAPAALSALEPPAAGQAPPPPPALELALPQPPLSSEAVILFNRGDAAGLASLAKSERDDGRRSALEWASLRADPHPSFEALAGFAKSHPGWPSVWIREREEAELAAHPETPAKAAEFFAAQAPQTNAGKIAAARAARALGREEEATQTIRALWRGGNFDAETESVILRDFGAVLAKDDFKLRADRLVYANYQSAGMRIATLAGPEVAALEQARIESSRAQTTPALLRLVPTALRGDPGLLFSRVQYARRAGRLYEAATLLSFAPRDRAALVSPDRWWSERKMVARALLDLGEPRLAFEVADGAPAFETSEAEVDARFHAGWIALRFLNDPELAAERFALATKAAENPLSAARAAYWQGRAAEAMGAAAPAKGFYERAAASPIAYYGQLAAQRLGLSHLALRAPTRAAEADQREGAVVAAEALYREGLDDLADSLALDAAKEWRDESQIAAMAEVVTRSADAGARVQFAKLALMRGFPLDATAFPTQGMPAFAPLARSADLPTVYAVARQESEFIWQSASWAGAKGLMQMLPATAASTARGAGVEFDAARLMADPAYNARLGALLLGQLIADEKGSRELAFAAYNAGPGRVQQWIAARGDPRDGSVDLVDWIERIPFDETRDYVQRVSENLAVYRQLFAEDPPPPAQIPARLARE